MIIKTRIPAIMIMLLTVSMLAQRAYSQTKTDLKESDLIYLALKEIVEGGKAPGMVAAIISSEGVISIGSVGVRKMGSAKAFTNNDIVHLGSCTKAMTATMIATLVAERKLTWDAKLLDVMPDLKGVIHPDFYGITLWQLLTHTAGVRENAMNWGAFGQNEIKERRLALLKENLASPAVYKTGEHHYSNFGYMVAACMAEKVTGKSWETLMKQRLFEPLGMATAGFGDPNPDGSVDQPWGHEGFGPSWSPSHSYDPEALGPAGEVHCSIADWGKFLSLQLADSNPILNKAQLDKLIEPEGFYAGGWGVAEQPWAKGIVLSHNGSNGNWYATVKVAPKLNRAYVVVTNSRDFSSTAEVCSQMIIKLIRMDLQAPVQ